MVAGYEVNGRVGRAIIPTHRERGFHPTGTCGTFGATAAAARLLGFDADKTANALGIAGSQAAGLYECHHDGTSTMIFHAGRAAQNGVEAALLVRAGMTGPATVLEGTKGFFRATSNAADPDAAMRMNEEFGVDRRRIHVSPHGPLFAEASKIRVDQPRVPLRDVGVFELQFLASGMRRIDDEYVGPPDQLLDDLLRAGRLQIKRDAALVAVGEMPLIGII